MPACFEAIDLAVPLRRALAAIRPLPNGSPAHWPVLRPSVVHLDLDATHSSGVDIDRAMPCTRLSFLAITTTDAVLRHDSCCCARMAHSVGDRVRTVPRCDRPHCQIDAGVLGTRVTVEHPRTVSVPPLANDALCLLPPMPRLPDQALAAAGRRSVLREGADGC